MRRDEPAGGAGSSGAVVPDQPAAPAAEPLDPELVGALLQLTADQREVVALRFIADLPLEDVARITRRSIGATKALQHRALENLRHPYPRSRRRRCRGHEHR